ncbi:gas vesicle protein GvpJ [Prescottella agglutinans]|uniref:gas vesicle protein GvpJ n=1 Tax=Prescottella agglutinans TaxID=1644129 RepID=UPI003D97EFE1
MTTGTGPTSSSLADVVDTILDKGLVIDAYVRVSLVGIELLTIDARIVVASVDTYLRFAEAADRLALGSEPTGLTDLVSDVKGSGSTKSKTKGVLDAVGETIGELLSEPHDEHEHQPARRRSRRRE